MDSNQFRKRSLFKKYKQMSVAKKKYKTYDWFTQGYYRASLIHDEVFI